MSELGNQIYWNHAISFMTTNQFSVETHHAEPLFRLLHGYKVIASKHCV